MKSSSPEEKITAVREMLSTTQENTKREFQGKTGNASKETKQVKKVLEFVLGRVPTDAEVLTAQTV